ncbi:MAG: hypothetical protein JO101_10840 [Candidatus Eremiobacteraeota bacterium]|nr:hypothetical protein [Candidatus Eremiobacteraeota bacterium]
MQNENMATVEADDLRSTSPVAYKPSQPLPPGAASVFGPKAAFGSPEFARQDAAAISPRIEPPPGPIPGWRIAGCLWPAERFVIRIPKQWNGRLVVAGTPSQRSEFANDRLWSDPLLARGYAYACGNKSLGDGVVVLADGAALVVSGVTMPRFNMPNGASVAFWHTEPGNCMQLWMDEFYRLTRLAQSSLEELHHRAVEVTYAVGLSNGGNQVRHALEKSDLYAGGLAWNAALWTVEHNLLRQLPPAIEAMEAGNAERLLDLDFPPDVRGTDGSSLYQRNLDVYWHATAWVHAATLDPEMSIPYGDTRDPARAEAWNGRMGSWRIDRADTIALRIENYAHTGRLRAKLIDLASEYDHLLPPKVHFEPYGRLVAQSGAQDLYRSALIPNAQHVDAWSEDPAYPQMRPGYPRVLVAFDELVAWVEG